jgi:hypothetical protein
MSGSLMDRTACCDDFQIAGQGQGNTTSTAAANSQGLGLYYVNLVQ